jgi:hypothetical protein
VVLQNARDVGVELAAFAVTKKGASFLRAEDEVDNDVGEGLGHGGGGALTGLGMFVRVGDLGLRSRGSRQPRL